MKQLLFILSLFILFTGCNDKIKIDNSLRKYFDEIQAEGSIVILDMKNGTSLYYNKERCDTGFLPASTFKIYNALIGLETGVIPDRDYVIPWDGSKQPFQTWEQDHTLASAIKNSVVWYFQELARRVGKEKMAGYLDALGYGNRVLTAPVDRFWLEGDLRITPNQQLALLQKLYADSLPFSKEHQQTVKDLLVVERKKTHIIRAKSGTVSRTPGSKYINWYVGWVETGDNVYFFITNLEKGKSDMQFDAAKTVTMNILNDLDVFNFIKRRL